MGNIITDRREIEYALKHIDESNLQMHGHVWTEHWRKGRLLEARDEGGNTFTTEGMAMILNTIFKASTTPAAIYCGIFKGNVTPLVTDTASGALGASNRFSECLDADYDSPATRATYTIATTATAACTNSASKAEFTIANSITVYGAFLATAQAKTATTGTLICAKRFTTSKVCEADDQLAITYGITLTTS